MNRPRMLGRLGTQTGGRVMTEKLLDSKNGLSLYRLALTDGKGEEVDVKFRLDGLDLSPLYLRLRQKQGRASRNSRKANDSDRGSPAYPTTARKIPAPTTVTTDRTPGR